MSAPATPPSFEHNVAMAMWANRDAMKIEIDDGQADTQTVRVTLSNGIDINMFFPNNGHPPGMRTIIVHGQDVINISGCCIIHHAWCSIQAHAMLRRLGDDLEITTPQFFKMRNLNLFDRLMGKERVLDTQAILVQRLCTRIEATMSSLDAHPSHASLDIGNGVTVKLLRYETHGQDGPEAEASCKSHGRLQISHARMARSFADLRARALSRLAGLDTTVIDPVAIADRSPEASALHAGQAALSLDMNLTDRAGIAISPLVNQHLPELIRRRDQALDEATTNEQRRLVTQTFDEGIGIVHAVIEDGLINAMRAPSPKIDDLLSHVRFLRQRHGHLFVKGDEIA